jgi:hypothetical protein
MAASSSSFCGLRHLRRGLELRIRSLDRSAWVAELAQEVTEKYPSSLTNSGQAHRLARVVSLMNVAQGTYKVMLQQICRVQERRPIEMRPILGRDLDGFGRKIQAICKSRSVNYTKHNPAHDFPTCCR